MLLSRFTLFVSVRDYLFALISHFLPSPLFNINRIIINIIFKKQKSPIKFQYFKKLNTVHWKKSKNIKFRKNIIYNEIVSIISNFSCNIQSTISKQALTDNSFHVLPIPVVNGERLI